ncbi:MAG: hypothetical protein M3O31_13710 [Acidobacteriota bacterium]|nr:hypothetical protein [Acidobacteriota bacterium]
MRRLAAILLLLCATTHCVLSIFYVNTSYLNLPSYARGTAPEPFQRRFLMVPVLRWAESSHVLQKAATRYGVNVPQREPMSPEKLACILVSFLLLNGLGLWTIRASEHLSIRHWWLLWALLLAILYASYAARYEQALWYPYDIPHLVFFGLATAFILSNRPAPFIAAFLLDAPTRETSIFLIPIALLVHLRSKAWRIAIAVCSVIWVLTRLLAQHLFPDGVHQWNGLHWYNELKPWHLPQVFSIAGFLWLPVWLGHKYLNRQERLALYAATAMIFVTFYFATWNETRAWSEWSVFFAILGAVQLERALASPSSQRPQGLS